MTGTHLSFIQLVRMGIGTPDMISLPEQIDWNDILSIATKQGLSAIVLDGIERIPEGSRPTKDKLLSLIGLTVQEERRYAIQWKASCELALLLEKNGLKTFVLKGSVVSECYPKPQHRASVDLDCNLRSTRLKSDSWELGNRVVQSAGFEVSRDYYKNSTWILPGLTVENHRFLTPFRGNRRLKGFEVLLQNLLDKDKGENRFEGTCLYKPPIMVSSLLLIEHAYSHFLHEGLTWRHVLDWMMFRRKHLSEIDWKQLEAWIEEFGFKDFYNSYYKLGKFLLGKVNEKELSAKDKMMLSDVWSPLDLHETVDGVKGKLFLAGNTWRARWKYREFTDMTWIKALWIQVKGFMFIKEPKL